MEQPFEIGQARYQSADDYIYANDPKLRFDQRRLASLVGYVAIGLPIIIGIGGHIWGMRPTLSHFYYERIILGDFFVGCLVFIGTVMFAYRGWSQKVADLASIAGFSAYLVAIIPTMGWFIGEDNAYLFAPYAAVVHSLAAVMVFLILAWFCFFVFTRIEPHQIGGDGRPLPAKRMRNRWYNRAGWVILLSILTIFICNIWFAEWTERNNIVFYVEAVMLIAFGISWLLKGRASGTLLQDPRDKNDEREVAEAKAGTA